MAKKAAVRSEYDVHPAVGMVHKWSTELPEMTGKSLEEWGEIVQGTGIDKQKAAIAWLQSEYQLPQRTALLIAAYALDQASWDGDPESYLKLATKHVDGMFTGKKAALRPVAETVITFARTLGTDVRICPCKTIIPFYRKNVFAQVAPVTQTRLELALHLGEVPCEGVLLPNPRAKGNDKLRHLIPLTQTADFTSEVKTWLKRAYQAENSDAD